MHRYSVQRACTVRQKVKQYMTHFTAENRRRTGLHRPVCDHLEKGTRHGLNKLQRASEKRNSGLHSQDSPSAIGILVDVSVGLCCHGVVMSTWCSLFCKPTCADDVYSVLRAFATAGQCSRSMYMQSVSRTPRRRITCCCTAPTIAVQIRTVIAQGQ